MKRINVIGTTSSGKSTFSKVLAEKLDCPSIQMDQLFWQADWGEATDDEFISRPNKWYLAMPKRAFKILYQLIFINELFQNH